MIVERYKPQLTVEDLEEILGIEKYDEEIAEKTRYFIRLFLSIFYRRCVTQCVGNRVSNRVRCKIGDIEISDQILQMEILLTLFVQSSRHRDWSRGLQLRWQREHTFHRSGRYARQRERAAYRKTW